MALRIAHLLPNLAIGGRERLANLLCGEAERRGIGSLLIGYDPLPANAAALSPLAPYAQLDCRAPDFAARMRALLAEHGIDVVHAQGHIPAFHLDRALPAGTPRPATLATVHIGLQGTWRWLWQIRSALRAMDELAAVSRPLARSYGRVAGRRIACIPNGIDAKTYAALGRSFPLSGPFRFAMLSRLDRLKRHRDAIAAADRLVASGLPVELHMAGEGPGAKMLHTLARERNWLVYAGVAADPAAFLENKHGFLLPSAREGMPMALAEAMAAGLPCIASDLPSIRDMAGDAIAYSPVGAVDRLATAMRALISDPAHWYRQSEAVRRRAQAFDIATTFDRYLDIYTGLTGKTP